MDDNKVSDCYGAVVLFDKMPTTNVAHPVYYQGTRYNVTKSSSGAIEISDDIAQVSQQTSSFGGMEKKLKTVDKYSDDNDIRTTLIMGSPSARLQNRSAAIINQDVHEVTKLLQERLSDANETHSRAVKFMRESEKPLLISSMHKQEMDFDLNFPNRKLTIAKIGGRHEREAELISNNQLKELQKQSIFNENFNQDPRGTIFPGTNTGLPKQVVDNQIESLHLAVDVRCDNLELFEYKQLICDFYDFNVFYTQAGNYTNEEFDYHLRTMFVDTDQINNLLQPSYLSSTERQEYVDLLHKNFLKKPTGTDIV